MTKSTKGKGGAARGKPTFIPVKTVSEANSRVHWRTRARRVKAHKATTHLALSALDRATISTPCVVSLVRRSPGRLDDDNVRGALKAVRDAIATWLGVDDGDEMVRYQYAQEKCKRKEEGVLVTFHSKTRLVEVLDDLRD